MNRLERLLVKASTSRLSFAEQKELKLLHDERMKKVKAAKKVKEKPNFPDKPIFKIPR